MRKNLSNILNYKKDIGIILIIILGAWFTYGYTVNFAVIGDGLMHMQDHTTLQQPGDWLRIFFATGEIQGKGQYVTNGFLRPIFNDVIVTFLKWISNYDIAIIRAITLAVHSINAIIAYIICNKLTKHNRLLSVCGSCVVAFGLTYYSGIYEVGLSFSMWLTCFALLAFLFVIYYTESEKKEFAWLSVCLTFLAMFTKESAVTLGIALTVFLLNVHLKSPDKINRKNVLIYALVQCAITALYFYCRVLKLGALTNIAGGIEGEVGIVGIIKKLIAYFLLSFNICTPVIEGYMLPDILCCGMLFTAIVALCYLALFVFIGFNFFKNKEVRFDIITGLIMFVICIAPTFKVTRNAPYYCDFSVIAALFLISTLGNIKFEKIKKIKILLVSCILCFMFVNWITLDYSWRTYATYLVIAEKNPTTIRDGILGDLEKYENVYQAISFEKNSDDLWIYNHGSYGGFYRYNIDSNANVQRATQENLTNISDDSVVIDYIRNKNNRDDVEVRYASADNNETCLLKVQVEQLDTYANNMLIFEYNYNEKDWIQEVDLSIAKSNGITELWFVLPKGVDYTITCDYVQSEEVLNWEDLQTRENDLQNIQIS